MTNILISEKIGERCISAMSGQILFRLISDAINGNDPIFLDFAGVSIFASPFFNHSIGRLYAENSKDELDNLIKIVNLNEVGQLIVSKVIENSQNFKNSKDLSAAIDQILQNQEKE